MTRLDAAIAAIAAIALAILALLVHFRSINDQSHSPYA